MNTKRLAATTIGLITIAGALGLAQTSAPTTDQLRQTVSRLRGNRIETPNSWDKLTPEQKK